MRARRKPEASIASPAVTTPDPNQSRAENREIAGLLLLICGCLGLLTVAFIASPLLGGALLSLGAIGGGLALAARKE